MVPGVLAQSYEIVGIADLRPHPKNARKSDNAAIDRSIASNGFYGAIYVQRSTGFILAGKHRWERAKAAGLANLPVLWLDVDDKAALKILAADNRVVDRAGYDEEALSELLTSILAECGSLEGSGYLPADFDKIIADAGDEVMRQTRPDDQLTPPPAQRPDPVPQPGSEPERQCLVVIRCKDESDQAEVLDRLSAEGFDCAPAYEP